MSELLCSGVTTIKGALGKDCNPGFIRGLLFSEDAVTPIAIGSAGAKSTWTALQKPQIL